jgi:predicted metalloendopeptidase
MAAYEQVGSSAFAAVRACTEQLLQNSDNAAAAALIPLHSSSNISSAQLSNTSRPTATDMRRIVALQQGVAQCWAINGANLRSMDPALYSIIETDLREDALIVADMMQGRLTLGDANRRMQSEDARTGAQFEARMRQTAAAFAQQHRAELAATQAEVQAMNQAVQNFNNQLQQQNQQQMLLNSLNRPRITTCNGFGGSVYCSTY